jgi:hypothetical protein
MLFPVIVPSHQGKGDTFDEPDRLGLYAEVTLAHPHRYHTFNVASRRGRGVNASFTKIYAVHYSFPAVTALS